jgi:hypothetical protein
MAIFFIYFANSEICWGNPLSVSLGAGTEIPSGVSLDARIGVKQSHIYGIGRYGLFIDPYVDLANEVSESFDFYNQATSEIISESLHGADHIEFGIGYEQSTHQGWFGELGYFSFKGEGSVSGRTLLEAVSGISVPNATNLYSVESSVKSLSLRLGYRWPILTQSSLWLSLGLIKPINSENSLDRPASGPVQEAILKSVNEEFQAYMDDLYKNEVFLPVIGLKFYYTF